jgi:lycopene beta-cyclase
VWSPEALARRSLQLFGLDALCAFDDGDARAFFAAFFALPRGQWLGFLDGTLSAAALRRAMLDVFTAVPGRLRLRLARGGLSPVAIDVARDLVRDLLNTGPAVAPTLVPGGPR